MDRRKTLWLVAFILAAVAAITTIALAGIISTRTATNHVETVVRRLDQSSARAECARQIAADLDEEWRKGVTGILNSTSRAQARAVAATLLHQPNSADLVNRRCPPAIPK